MRFLLLFVVFITLVLNFFENSSAIETHISPASLFGDVEVMPSLGVYYLPLKEYAIDKRSIFRAFVILKSYEPQNSTRARLGSLQVGYGRHVIAKYDSLVNDYVWATAIDSGNTCFDFLVLPSCDNKSVITLLGLCSGNFPQFSITRSDKYSVMIKFDGNGTYVWHKMFNSSTYHTARLSCEENNEDVIYLSSGFDQNIQLDNVTLLGSDSTFLAKLDHEASVVWAAKTTGIRVTSLASDDQYLYLGGVLKDASFGNFSLNLTSSGGGLFLGVLDKDDGEVLGLTPFAIGSSWSAISRIDVGPRQTIFVSGYLAVRETLGSTTIYATEDTPSSFLMQYNTTKQEVVWSTALFPQGTYDGVLDMKIDQNGLIHLVGLFNCSGTLHDKYGCSANTYNGFYTTFTNNGELFSFLPVSGKWAYALVLTVADDGYISIYGEGAGLTFPQGPSLNLTGDTYVFIAEVIEPRVEAFKVTPNQGTMLYEDFLFSTNDDLFSTYRFGFIDENNQRVFLSGWTNARAMNTTMTTAGNATVFVQALSQHGTTVEWTSSIEVLDPNTSSLNVAPYRGAMLYDYFVFSVSGEFFSTHRFGFLDGKGQRVFLSGWTNDRVLNTTMSTTGNFTVFAQGLSTHGNIMEWTSRVEVYQGETARVAQALVEQGNKLNQLNGTLLEQQLTDYTHSLVESIQIIPFNQSTQLLSYLMNLIESKQNELSGSATLETVKSISQQHSFLSENATIQASNILTNIMKNNNTSIADSIVVAYNIANVMISSNSSQSQKKSFTSMVSVLTEKIRGNMTEGQTSELSLPYLETVITKINQSSILSFNTTIVVKQPSSGASNNGNVTIVIPTSLLSQSNASFIQCEAIANPPDPYPTKCNTNQVSPTISTMLFTDNQQLIQNVDSSSRVSIESMVTIPNTLNSTMGDLYKYACKYLDRNSHLWKNDSSICHTGVTSLDKSTNEAISVQCQCSQPVTHAVSLDYVQSSDGLDESNIGVGQACTNPCGCSQTNFGKTSNKKGMKAYGIALIILACLTMLVIVIAAFALVVILLSRAALKRGSTIKNTEKKEASNEIESRFDMMYK